MPRSSYMMKKSTNKEDEARRQKRRNYVLSCSNNPTPNTYEPFVSGSDDVFETFLVKELNEVARKFIETGDESLIEHFPKPRTAPSAVR